jgi:opacity protein-like surface antigen
MKKKIVLLAFFAVVTLSVAFAQDITGHWTGKVMNQYNVEYDFKVQGNSLTGKDTHPDGSVSDISNGVVGADTLAFDVPIQGAMTHVTGKIKGNIITLSVSIQGNDESFDIKKAEATQ